VNVVRVVHHRVRALRLRHLDVALVRGDGAPVRLGRVGVAPDAHVDVGRHVHQVAGGRRESGEPLRARQCPLRARRRFDGVDVVVVRAQVVRVLREHAFEDRDDLRRAGRRLAIERPQLPRPQHHQGLGVERGRIEVVRVPAHDAAHGVGVVAVELHAIGAGGTRVALRERIDVVTLGGARRRRERDRLRHGLARHEVARIVDRQVVVRSRREGDAPPGHGAAGVEPRRLTERAHRLVVIESVDQAEALIEVALGLRVARRDRMAVGTKSVEDGRTVRGRWRVLAMLARAQGGTGHEHEQRDDEGREPHACRYAAISPLPLRTNASRSSA
jgi:hypothetical protein